MAEILKELDEFELQEQKDEKGVFYVKNYDELLNWTKEAIASYEVKDITNDVEKKEAKDFRAKCNKACTQIKSLRLSLEREILGTFKSQSMAIEKLFEAKGKEVSLKVHEYEDAQKKLKDGEVVNTLVQKEEVSFKLTFAKNEKLIQKLIKFCEENNIEMGEIK